MTIITIMSTGKYCNTKRYSDTEGRKLLKCYGNVLLEEIAEGKLATLLITNDREVT